MNVLRFNDEFDDLIEEPISYWKTSDDIPQNIKDFIIETSNSISIFDDSFFFLPAYRNLVRFIDRALLSYGLSVEV